MILTLGLGMIGAAAVLGAVGATSQPASAERAGAVTMKGNPLTLVGPVLKAGDKAPAFTVVANDLSPFKFTPGDGKTYIIAAVPSLDTGVCATETRRFNQEAASLGNIQILTISQDLPFAQKRWCGAEGVDKVKTLSDYRDRAFGPAYGVWIKELGLLTRAIFVIDGKGTIAYAQLVPEIAQEPDYAAALAAAKAAAH